MTHAPLGRDDELDRLLHRMAATRTGEGSVALIEGEGGTGKTALVTALLAAARRGEHHVLHGRSWELSAAVPYESLVSAFSRHLRARTPEEVARLTAGLPTLGALIDWLDLQPPTTAPEAFKVRAQDAFAILLARLGAERPVVLALDDLHWADQASLEVLQYLCLDLPDAPFLLVGTTRPEEAERRPELRQLLAGLRRAPWTTTIRLGRLDRWAVDAIVASHLGGDVTPRIYEVVAARSGGTPLLVHELLDDLTERSVIVRDRGVWRIGNEQLPLPRSATDLIRSRLDRVQAEDRAVLEALAVVNGPTDPMVVASLLGIDVGAVERALERLRAIRLAMETDSPNGPARRAWTVEHPVIAEVVEAELVDAARRRLHRRLLDVDADAPVGRRARHALIAGETSDRDATIALLVDAGTEALRRATPAAAIEPLRGALALMGERGLHRDERAVGDVALRHRIERDLGLAYLRQLEVRPALTHLRAAWERAERDGDVVARLELLHPLDNAEFRAGSEGVSAAALEALRARIAADQAWGQLVELAWVHLSHAGRGQSAGELHRAVAALDLVPAGRMPPRGEALREVLTVYDEVGAGRQSAGERFEQLVDAAARWDAHPEIAQRCVLLAYDAAILSGDPTLLARCRTLHRQIEERTGEPPTWRQAMAEGLRSIAEGRLDERPADLRLHGASARSTTLAAVMDAFATRYAEGPAAALEVLDAAFGPGEGGRGVAKTADKTARLYAAFGRLLVVLGRPEESDAARAVVAEVGGDRVLAPVAGFAFGGAAALARGLAEDDGERDAAIAELDAVGAGRWLPSAWAALLRARQVRAPADRAAELLRAADVLAALGRRLESAERVIDAAEADGETVGVERLATALSVARDANAGWLVARAERLLPNERTAPAVRGGDGPLTARELEVASLVTAGLTNREIASELFISIRTVTSHLDHIYTKLGLSSRDGLAEWHRAAG